MTSAGSRIVMSFLGFVETGRPPFLTTARASISGVSSGSSAYSPAFVRCESTRARSDFKERRDTRFFAGIGFPHTEYMSRVAARCVPDYDHSTEQEPVTDDPGLTVILARILDFKGDAFKDDLRVLEGQATRGKRLVALDRVEGDTRMVNVTTETCGRKWGARAMSRRNLTI